MGDVSILMRRDDEYDLNDMLNNTIIQLPQLNSTMIEDSLETRSSSDPLENTDQDERSVLATTLVEEDDAGTTISPSLLVLDDPSSNNDEAKIHEHMSNGITDKKYRATYSRWC